MASAPKGINGMATKKFEGPLVPFDRNSFADELYKLEDLDYLDSSVALLNQYIKNATRTEFDVILRCFEKFKAQKSCAKR
jgi:hypothetical protein